MKVSILQARAAHVALIKDQLRPESALETQKIGADSEVSILKVMNMSETAWSGFVDKEIVCMWGLYPHTLVSKHASLWLITTKLVEQHPFVFLRWSQRFMEELRKQDRFSIINGCVREDFARSIWWIKWLGFSVNPPSPGSNIRYFHWEKPL